jgi:hypothetical protein
MQTRTAFAITGIIKPSATLTVTGTDKAAVSETGCITGIAGAKEREFGKYWFFPRTYNLENKVHVIISMNLNNTIGINRG